MIDRGSREWEKISQAVQIELNKQYKALRTSYDDQFTDTKNRFKALGFIDALEWVLKLPDKKD